jgi:cyclase
MRTPTITRLSFAAALFAMLATASWAEPQGAAPGQGAPGGAGAGRQGGGPPPAPPAIKQVKPGVFVVTGLGGNSTVRVTNDGIILVDTKNRGDDNYKALMEQVRTVSPAPVKYVFITHHHQDHSGNIGNFQDAGAEVIVHENLNKNLETYAPPQGKPALAKVTYGRDRKVKVADAAAEAHHYFRGHTSGDTVVYFPDVKLVSLGDLVVANAPNVDFPFGGSLIEYQRTLEQILRLDFDMAIPGHGDNPMTKAEVQAFKTKVDAVLSRAKALVTKGTPKDQLMAQLKTDDLGWNLNTPQWTQAARLDPLYDELSKAK